MKSPKLFFYDTGLMCSLLGLRRADLVETYYMRGALFENWVLSEVAQHFTNQGQKPPICFWQDKTGREVDLLVETNEKLIPIEIKAGQTKRPDYCDQLAYWNQLCGNSSENSFLLYGGSRQSSTKMGSYIPIDTNSLILE